MGTLRSGTPIAASLPLEHKVSRLCMPLCWSHAPLEMTAFGYTRLPLSSLGALLLLREGPIYLHHVHTNALFRSDDLPPSCSGQRVLSPPPICCWTSRRGGFRLTAAPLWKMNPRLPTDTFAMLSSRSISACAHQTSTIRSEKLYRLPAAI